MAAEALMAVVSRERERRLGRVDQVWKKEAGGGLGQERSRLGVAPRPSGPRKKGPAGPGGAGPTQEDHRLGLIKEIGLSPRRGKPT